MSRVIIFGASPLPIENEKKISGPGIRTWQFAKPLLDDQHEICLISLRDASAYFEDEPKSPHKIRGLEYHLLSEDKFKDTRFIQNLADRFRPDCMVSISSFLVSKTAAEIKTSKPIWFDRGDLMAEAQLKSYNDRSDAILAPFYNLERHILSKGDVFSAVSFPQKCAVIGRLGGIGRLSRLTLGYEFVHVIPCAVDEEEYRKKRVILRGKVAGQDDFVVLWSGGYNTWVDVDTLFRGLEAAISKNKKIKFVSTGGSLAGQDDFTYKRFLDLIQNSKYKEHFVMLGWVPFYDLPDIYLESDLGLNIDKHCYETLLGSRHRLLGWMKAGLPFATTTPSEFTQFLCSKKLAFPFNSGDADSLSATILKLSKNRKILAGYSAHIKNFVRINYLYKNTTSPLRDWVSEPRFAPDKFSEDKKSKKMVLKPSIENLDIINFQELEKQLSIVKVQNRGLQLANANLTKHASNLTKHASNLEQLKTALQLANANLTKRACNLEQAKTELTQHIVHLNGELKNLRLQAANLEAGKKHLEAQVRKLTRSLDNIYNSKPYKIYKMVKRLGEPFSYFWQGLHRGVIFVNVKHLIYRSKTYEAVSATDDPQIYLYHNFNLAKPFDASRYRFIRFSLFVDRATQGQLIWWLQDGRWQTSRSFEINAGWHNYCFDMKAMPTQGESLGSGIGWEGLVSKIRLDPAEEEGIKIRIKDIECTPSNIKVDQQMDSNSKINYEDCKNLPLVVKSKPALIYAEISTKCNLRCRMCGRYSYHIPSSRQGFMKREVFHKLSELFTPGMQLALFGQGETLLHPDLIYFLELVNKAQIKVGFNTNGLPLTPKIARAMVENKQAHIVFSCSAGSPQTYHKIHGRDAWGKLWDNIKMLNEAKRKYGLPQGEDIINVHPVAYLEFVSQLSNISELPALLRRAFSYQMIGLTVINLTAHSDAMEKERMNTPENIPLADKYYKEALGVYEEMIKVTNRDFDFRLPNSYSALTKKFITEEEKQIFSEMREGVENGSGLKRDNFCLEPWQTFYVRFDGTVAPCVITGRKLGDLSKNTAEEIWNGEVYQKFRKRMKSKAKPYECLHCHLFPGPKRYDTKLGDASIYEPL